MSIGPNIRASEPSPKQVHSSKKPTDTKQAQPEPTPALATPTAVPSPSPLRQETIEEKAPANKQEQYDAASDKLYRWYLRATIIGVGVAVIGFGLLIVQTIANIRAANAAKESADAALKSATAVIDSERAWIVADPETPPPFVKDHITRIIIRLRNVGKTPARIIEIAERVFAASKACPLPENPEYLRDNIHRAPAKGGALMAPSATMSRLVHIDPGEMERIDRGKSILYVYGYVIYRDVFSEEEHRTDYGFVLNIPFGGADPVTRMFVMSDLPGYNEAT